jgi:hypothetical protein
MKKFKNKILINFIKLKIKFKLENKQSCVNNKWIFNERNLILKMEKRIK